MVENDLELDKQLDTYRVALDDVKAPGYLKGRIVGALNKPSEPQVVPMHTAGKPYAKRGFFDSRWLWATGTACLVIMGAAFVLNANPPVLETKPGSNLKLASNAMSYPVRVHSLARGAEWRYLRSEIVKDQRGFARLVVVNTTYSGEYP